jgi:glutathionyl-hydroquinone reductase
MGESTTGSYVSSSGEFNRDQSYITTRITADGRDGYSAEPGRYRLVVSRACPWANRSIIVRRLLGLEVALSMGVASPVHGEESWNFDLDPDGRDPVLGIHQLREAYDKRAGGHYERGITVPALVDTTTGEVVTNDYAQITLDMSTEWTAYHRDGAPQLYPEHLREEIDHVNKFVFADVNNGVYRAGFARSQAAYDRAFTELFESLDWLERRLRARRYLAGDVITEADWRLFPTLVRFDPVYHTHFRCNGRLLTQYPSLWAYARELYQQPGIAETVELDQIKRHYYTTHDELNPKRIVPLGPLGEDWLAPHGRK